MLIAGLTLGLGIVAVFLAIIYRINAMDDKAPQPVAPSAAVPTATIAPPPAIVVQVPPAAVAPPTAAQATSQPASLSEADKQAVLREAQASIPADARLMASTVAGDRIVLTYEHFAGTLVLLFDPGTLDLVGRIEIAATP